MNQAHVRRNDHSILPYHILALEAGGFKRGATARDSIGGPGLHPLSDTHAHLFVQALRGTGEISQYHVPTDQTLTHVTHAMNRSEG